MSMTESMTIEDLKDAVCDLVSIAEEHVERKYFEELDNKGVAIIDALDEFRELKEKATAKKPKMVVRYGCTTHECPNCGQFLHDDQNFCHDCGTEFDWSEGKE